MAVLFYINTSILLLLLIETLEQFSALFFSSINESTQSIPTTNCISFRFYMQPGLFTCWHSDVFTCYFHSTISAIFVSYLQFFKDFF